MPDDDPIDQVASRRPRTTTLSAARREALWAAATTPHATNGTYDDDPLRVLSAPDAAPRRPWRAATVAVAAALLLAVLVVSSSRNDRARSGAASSEPSPIGPDVATTADGPINTVEPTTTVTVRRPFVAPDCSVARPPEHVAANIDVIGPALRIGTSMYWNRGVLMPAGAAGPIVGTVCRRAILADEDGDAPFAPGTAIHAVAGYDPRFRVGVADGEQVQVFEVFDDPQATTGADLLDLSPGVDAVELRDFDGGGAVLATWTDDRVQALATGITRAPVARDAFPVDGQQYLVVFRMRDGTTVERVFDRTTGRLERLQLDAPARALFDDAPPLPPRPVATTTETVAPPTSVSGNWMVPATSGQVDALAAALGVTGEIELVPAERGDAQCVNRLGPTGFCVNAPLWGAWQYWDLAAQSLPAATDDEATAAATAIFERLTGTTPTVETVRPNGPLPQVQLGNGAIVMVAEGGRIVSVIAPVTTLPAA